MCAPSSGGQRLAMCLSRTNCALRTQETGALGVAVQLSAERARKLRFAAPAHGAFAHLPKGKSRWCEAA